MTPQILMFVDSLKIQKSKYLENETFFFSNEKIHSLNIKGYNMAKFLAEVTFNENLRPVLNLKES